MALHTLVSLAHLPPNILGQQVNVVVLDGKPYKELTEMIARLALRGSFHWIVGGEWIPDQDTLRRTVHRHTVHIGEVLDRPTLGRPSTYLQLRDQLVMAGAQPHPLLITDFLNRFYDRDVNLSLRQRVLKECCQLVKLLAKTRPVFILTQYLSSEEYQLFFPMLESIADNVLEVKDHLPLPAIQYSFL